VQRQYSRNQWRSSELSNFTEKLQVNRGTYYDLERKKIGRSDLGKSTGVSLKKQNIKG
jgi:hypothetical protein